MAADAVDACDDYIPTRVAPSITERVPLLGADGYFALINQCEHLGKRFGLHPYRVRRLLNRYGSLIDDVLYYADADPSLLRPLAAAPQYLRVEVVYAAIDEAALHLEDVLARRTRIAIEYSHRGVGCAQEVAELLAPILDWDAERIAFEVETYNARVAAEIASQQQPDDASADALRAAAPESRQEILEPVPVPDN